MMLWRNPLQILLPCSCHTREISGLYCFGYRADSLASRTNMSLCRWQKSSYSSLWKMLKLPFYTLRRKSEDLRLDLIKGFQLYRKGSPFPRWCSMAVGRGRGRNREGGGDLQRKQEGWGRSSWVEKWPLVKGPPPFQVPHVLALPQTFCGGHHGGDCRVPSAPGLRAVDIARSLRWEMRSHLWSVREDGQQQCLLQVLAERTAPDASEAERPASLRRWRPPQALPPTPQVRRLCEEMSAGQKRAAGREKNEWLRTMIIFWRTRVMPREQAFHFCVHLLFHHQVRMKACGRDEVSYMMGKVIFFFN